MKLTVVLLLCVALSQSAEVQKSSKTSQKTENGGKAEKRALTEGNVGLQKRTPTSAIPTPGIEYADNKESQQDKSPTQQIYATPTPPQVAKISDVLTGHGVHFPAAIASHLYSPVSVYQARLGSPTTYEVSAPVPSQLAYTEHKIIQPPQNTVQYYSAPQKIQNSPNKQVTYARLAVFSQQPQQPVYVQPQQILYAQQQTQSPQIPQQLYQYSLPQLSYTQPQPSQVGYTQNQVQQTYQQNPQISYTQNQIQQVNGYTQNQEQPQVQYIQPIQRELPFAKQQQVPRLEYRNQQNQAPQKELKAAPTTQGKVFEKQILLPQPTYNVGQQGGSISYATFSQYQPSPNYGQSPTYIQPSVQYEPAQKLDSPSLNLLQALPKQQQQQVIYLNANQIDLPHQNNQHLQGQVYQQQPYYQGQEVQIQNSGYAVPQAVAVAPTFPPVQYFGKFAQNIFGGYHQ